MLQIGVGFDNKCQSSIGGERQPQGSFCSKREQLVEIRLPQSYHQVLLISLAGK